MGDVRYYEPIQSGDIIYSIDMLTFIGSHSPDVSVPDFPWSGFRTMAFLDAFVARLRDFAFQEHFDYQHYDSFTFLTYRDMWVCKGEQGETVKFFFGFRGYDSSGVNQWKIQFNPNKVLPCDGLVDLIRWIVSVSGDCRISSFDGAADFPCARSDVFMVKDKRKYQLIINSAEDKTEYLGCRGENGFVKLYNKRLESQLDYNLTRFELSVVFDSANSSVLSVDALRNRVPAVYVLGRQLRFDDRPISGADSILLRFCLEHPDGLLMLNWKQKKKILGLLDVIGFRVNFDVMLWISQYYKYRDIFGMR